MLNDYRHTIDKHNRTMIALADITPQPLAWATSVTSPT